MAGEYGIPPRISGNSIRHGIAKKTPRDTQDQDGK